jgi:hypothetical protein
MNITTHARFSVVLLLTMTVGLATAYGAQDPAATVQVDPASTHYTIRSVTNGTYLAPSSQQRIALLIAPSSAAATRAQVLSWNNPQSVRSAVRHTSGTEEVIPPEGSLVLPVVTVHWRLGLIKLLTPEVREKVLRQLR